MERDQTVTLKVGRDSVRFGPFVRSMPATLLVIVLFACLVGPFTTWSKENAEQITAAVVANFPPHYTLNPFTGAADGFAIDVLEAVAARADVAVRYKIMDTWNDAHTALKTGTVDIIPNMGVTEERAQWADYTSVIETQTINLFVRSSNTEIRGPADLSGRRVSVVELNVGVALMTPRKDIALIVHRSLQEALLALLAGQTDALIYPANVLNQLARNSGVNKKIKIIGEPLREIKRAIAVRKGQPELLSRLDKSVREFARTAEYENIFMKWYGKPSPYWDQRRIVTVMGIVLLATVMGLALWRYISVVKLNKSLSAAIAERRAVEEALRVSEARFKNFAETAADWFWELGPDLRFTYFSGRYQDIMGVSPDRLIGKTRAEIHSKHADHDSEKFKQHLRELQDRRPFEDYELRWRRPDGEMRTIQLSGKPFFDAAGAFQGYRGTGRDVTLAKQAEDELRLRTRAIEAVSDGVIIADATLYDCPIIYCNPAFERISGYSAAEVIGRNCRFLQGPGTDTAATARLRQAVVEAKNCRVTFKNYRKDGQAFWNELTISPVCDANGRLSHFVGIQNDITERREAETVARKRLEELAHASRLATMGEMVFGIAHEVNQPLAAIVSFAEAGLGMLESGDGDQALIVDTLKEIARQGERAGEIVRRLRHFVRKGEVQRQPTDINELVLAVLDLLPHELRDRNIEMHLALDDDLPAVAADRIQIEQVLLNLLRNAIDAMQANHSGGQVITIHTSAGDGETIEVAVSDTGRGLMEDSLEQVFDTFFTTKDSGMGMGLSISRSIIQAHGGRIWVTRNQSSGVTFRFTLPRRQIETHAA